MTMTHCAPTVNPTLAEVQIADLLAWNADGGAPEDYPGFGWTHYDSSVEDAEPVPAGYEPGWQDESTNEATPSVEDEYFETGREVGATGASPHILEVFGHHSAATRLEGEASFYLGVLEGRRLHAFRAGYALGVAGQFCERPASIHRRFRREFNRGWQLGADAWADRQEIMAGWALDDQADAEERELEEHNREAGGWLRAGHVA